jgi:CRISPR type I-E-associated protein CasB/Cse2
LRDDALKSLETVQEFFENFEKTTHRQARYESLSKTNVSIARATFEPQAEHVLRNVFTNGNVIEQEINQSLQETLTNDKHRNTQTFQTNTEARPGYLAFLNRLKELPASDLKLLRENTGGTPGSDVRAFDLFTEIFWELRQKHKQLNKETCWLVATLYSWHSHESHDAQYGSLASVLKRVHQKTCRNDESKKTAQNRFIRMLNLPRKELGPPLADVLRLFNRQGLAVYWPRLLDDLSRWNDPDRSVQQCWEQEYQSSRKQ